MSERVLVTGVSGFIAKHVALALRDAGFQVRGTVRDVKKSAPLEKLFGGTVELVRADLLADDGWAEAMAGVSAVAHVASPFPAGTPADENDLIRPAVDGTLRVFRAATAAGVKKLVQTSSIVAVSYGHPSTKTQFSADDWSVLGAKGVGAYAKSKVLAERAARAFMADEGAGLYYASINPGLVLGPLLDKDYGTSAALVLKLLRGAYPALPRIPLMTVDVRDVAQMHVAALARSLPSGGRYLAVAGAPHMSELARAIKAALGPDARKVPTRTVPDFIIRAVALFDPSLRDAVPLLGKTLNFDTGPAERDLGTRFIPATEAAVATARSLRGLGIS